MKWKIFLRFSNRLKVIAFSMAPSGADSHVIKFLHLKKKNQQIAPSIPGDNPNDLKRIKNEYTTAISDRGLSFRMPF